MLSYICFDIYSGVLLVCTYFNHNEQEEEGKMPTSREQKRRLTAVELLRSRLLELAARASEAEEKEKAARQNESTARRVYCYCSYLPPYVPEEIPSDAMRKNKLVCFSLKNRGGHS